MTKFRPFESSEYLSTPQARAAYLREMWELSNGDPAMVAAAAGEVAKAIGMSEVARRAGISREALYKAFSGRGNPELATFLGVLGALGLKLSVQPATKKPTAKRPATRTKKTAARGARKTAKQAQERAAA